MDIRISFSHFLIPRIKHQVRICPKDAMYGEICASESHAGIREGGQECRVETQLRKMVDEKWNRIETGEVHKNCAKQENDWLRQFGNEDDPVSVTAKQYTIVQMTSALPLAKFRKPNIWTVDNGRRYTKRVGQGSTAAGLEFFKLDDD